MVAFPSLEVLELDYLETLLRFRISSWMIANSTVERVSDIWGKHYQNDDNIVSSFCKLKRLDVTRCDGVEYVIPLPLLYKLQNLEYLNVSRCSSVISEVGPSGSNTPASPLMALRDLKLTELHCLTKTGLALYPNLENLELRACELLQTVFQSSSIARRLVHLKTMSVVDCTMIKEIIGETEHEEITDDSNIVFPELVDLKLCRVAKMSNFWCNQSGEASTYKVEFPKLVNLDMFYGGNSDLQLEGMELGSDDFTGQLVSLKIVHDDINLPRKWQHQLHNLEELDLSYCWWHDLKSLSLHKLKVLKVDGLKCSTLFPFSVLRSLQQVQLLEISSCPLLEQIVVDVKGIEPSAVDYKTITLFKLKSVVLKDLPKLKSFIHGATYDCHMPALEELEVDKCGFSNIFTCSVSRHLQQLKKLKVSNCRLLEGIVEDVRDDEASDANDKFISLFRLSTVVLKNLPNFKSYFPGANFGWHMPALSKVKVENCVFSTLFTCSFFRTLKQLKDLQVSNCKLLEAVVEDVRGGETFDTNDKIITLPQLEKIYLNSLPNLKSFSPTANYAFNMPKLDYFTMFTCPQVENFTSMKTNTGSVCVHTCLHNCEHFPDLNEYINEYCKRDNCLSENAGESSSSNEEPETDSEVDEEPETDLEVDEEPETESEADEEKQCQDTEEDDQP